MLQLFERTHIDKPRIHFQPGVQVTCDGVVLFVDVNAISFQW